MRRSLPVLLSVTALPIALLSTGVASAAPTNLIKVDKSINAIKIGNSEKKVIQKMGTQPTKVQTGVNDFGSYRILFFKHKFSVTVLKGGTGVVNMETTSSKQRTADDIGVGSTRSELRAAYTVVCEPVPSQPGRQSCLTDPNPRAGEISTVFRLKNKVVTEVGIATVLD